MNIAKVLIANRGEIALRVARTCREMGLRTVAVYSDADRAALHVRSCDEAVRVGPPASRESYLSIENIIAAARKTRADAVHPGYGFLSENARFARACAEAGLVFIGPPPEAMEEMGEKTRARRKMIEAGVPVVPGLREPIPAGGEAAAKEFALQIGYPIMLKAAAGGGGKGMRLVTDPREFDPALATAQREASNAFGDGRVYLEKAVARPRHVEIQVFADQQGGCIWLGERECSVQRRHQKVIEETPSALVTPEMRQAMGRVAVEAARAVDYVGAGTCEFLVDGNTRSFFFLEMNTRLQVEHPVTELVTGIDLVEQMIRVAAGDPLAIKQQDVKLAGWAVESRIYAEDPFRSFLPSTGRLVRYRPPEEGTRRGATVRNDTGVYEGGEISIWYDPMIAKLVTLAASREQAIDAQANALDRFAVDGIRHNIPFLAAVMQNERFRSGKLSTAFIAEEFPDGFRGREPEGRIGELMAAVAAAIDLVVGERKREISGQLPSRPVRRDSRRVVKLGETEQRLEVAREGDAIKVRMFEGESREKSAHLLRSAWKPGDLVWTGTVDEHPLAVQVRAVLNGFDLAHRGIRARALVYTEREAAAARLMPVKVSADTGKKLRCPMPGLVVSIGVKEGQQVRAGETLAVVEAMKMENVLRAEQDATVSRILAKPGDSLAVDAVILEFA